MPLDANVEAAIAGSMNSEQLRQALSGHDFAALQLICRQVREELNVLQKQSGVSYDAIKHFKKITATGCIAKVVFGPVAAAAVKVVGIFSQAAADKQQQTELENAKARLLAVGTVYEWVKTIRDERSSVNYRKNMAYNLLMLIGIGIVIALVLKKFSTTETSPEQFRLSMNP